MNYSDLLKELEVPIVWSPEDMDSNAWYLPNAFEYGEHGAIFVKSNLSEIETECAILHEIGHIIKGRTLSKLNAEQRHLVNEAKADRYMIHRLLEKFIDALDGAIEYFQIDKFLEWAGLSRKYYDVAEQEALEIMGKNYDYEYA